MDFLLFLTMFYGIHLTKAVPTLSPGTAYKEIYLKLLYIADQQSAMALRTLAIGKSCYFTEEQCHA